MRIIILAAIISILPSRNLFAQYTCEELPQLQQIVRQLTQDCGSQSVCYSQLNGNKYPGQNINASIERCKRVSGYSEGSCSRNVTCEGSQSICYSQLNGNKYPGQNINAAIERCERISGYSEGSCSRNVTCN